MDMQAYRVKAPAKVNLALRVLGRRRDGFHELESLMVPISVHDVLTFERTGEHNGLRFSCDDASIPADESNLVVRAVRWFERKLGRLVHVGIHLQKGIPHGAGLGGGSSDAAATLLALNTLHESPCSEGELAEGAAELGSDVPFFVYGRAAWIRGRGERVEPVEGMSSVPLLLIKPPFAVPTPWAYRRWKDALEIPGVDYGEQILPWGTLGNDLERPVFEKYLFLADLKTWLREQPEVEGALMSGSGATVFGVLQAKELGAALAARILDVFGSEVWTACCETLPVTECLLSEG